VVEKVAQKGRAPGKHVSLQDADRGGGEECYNHKDIALSSYLHEAQGQAEGRNWNEGIQGIPRTE